MITSYEFLANWLRARFDDEHGASLVEYALLVALIAVVCIAAITLLGKQRLDEVQQRRQLASPTEPTLRRNIELGAGDEPAPKRFGPQARSRRFAMLRDPWSTVATSTIT